MSRPRITLAMIVKNEQAIIRRCLDSVRGLIDHLVITDTGSTDSTVAIIEDWKTMHAIPGKVCHDPWVNFGHNRTRSVEHAVEWLRDRDGTHFILTIDADMVACCPDPERVRQELASADMWMVQQRNHVLQYENVRFFRSTGGCCCVGVTHEYWEYPSPYQQGRMPPSAFYLEDYGDGGSKSDKFQRDIRLLRAGLEEEPNNVRYLFYLAQSYSDSGNDEEALRWYQRRVDAGGWCEERFIAHKRMGEIHQRQGRPEKAVEAWLNAWEAMPNRSESLYEIVKLYRIRERYQIALLFLEKAMTIPFPKDAILFVEHPVYRYRLMEELSILGYYVNLRSEGRTASQALLLSKEVPANVKELAHRNSSYYLNALPVVRSGTLSWSLPESSNGDTYRTGSGCFSEIDHESGNVVGIVRTANYHITDEFQYDMAADGVVRTQNYWVKGNQLTAIRILEPPRRESHVRGMEDIRWVEREGCRYGIGVSWEYGDFPHPSVILLRLGEDGTVDRLSPIRYRNEDCQKNWTLYVEEGTLYAVYSHSPLTLLSLSVDEATFGEHQVVMVKEPAFDLSTIRGSANPIWIRDERVVLVHGVVFSPRRKYYHRFLRYDREWTLKGVSEPFYFSTLFVEFSLSCLSHPERETLTIFFSRRDATTEWIEVEWKSIQWLSFMEPSALKNS